MASGASKRAPSGRFCVILQPKWDRLYPPRCKTRRRKTASRWALSARKGKRPGRNSKVAENILRRNSWKGGATMNKSELIAQVAEKTGLTKRAAGESVEAVFEHHRRGSKAGEKVTSSGLAPLRCATVPPAKASTQPRERPSKSPKARCLPSKRARRLRRLFPGKSPLLTSLGKRAWKSHASGPLFYSTKRCRADA